MGTFKSRCRQKPKKPTSDVGNKSELGIKTYSKVLSIKCLMTGINLINKNTQCYYKTTNLNLQPVLSSR